MFLGLYANAPWVAFILDVFGYRHTVWVGYIRSNQKSLPPLNGRWTEPKPRLSREKSDGDDDDDGINLNKL
jgi:hypothetical protein